MFVQVAQLSQEDPASGPPNTGRADCDAEALTRKWLAEQGFVGQLVVRSGEELVEILGAAAEQAAPFLVCGSRQLSAVERVLGLSLSSSLAAQAAIPVLVAPSGARA